jgi:hypothetical protein
LYITNRGHGWVNETGGELAEWHAFDTITSTNSAFVKLYTPLPFSFSHSPVLSSPSLISYSSHLTLQDILTSRTRANRLYWKHHQQEGHATSTLISPPAPGNHHKSRDERNQETERSQTRRQSTASNTSPLTAGNNQKARDQRSQGNNEGRQPKPSTTCRTRQQVKTSYLNKAQIETAKGQ